MPPRKRAQATPAAATSAGGSAARASASSAPASRTYQSSPALQQLTFPARRRVVKTYGGRRSLPAELEAGGSRRQTRSARRLRQQTLTQIDYVRASGVEVEDEDEDEEVGLGEEGERDGELARGKGLEQTGSVSERGRRAAERRSKRRKTMGDVPVPTLERRTSSFHTQTLTQFLGKERGDDHGLRVEDEDEEREGGNDKVSLPGGSITPTKQHAPIKGGKAKAPASTGPHTPSNKRIKVNIDEVPSSQPTPFTPLLGHYSPIPLSTRSPLAQKSTNLDAPPPTVETVSKLPRNLVIQDSYSTGSSDGLPSSSVAGESPKKEGDSLRREPLAEIPLASLELGGTPADGETPNTARKRLFFEIPDSDDDLESIGSTPFKTRSTQQTPLRKVMSAAVNFAVPADLGSSQRPPGAAVANTPSGSSNKENSSPAIQVWEDDGESTASEGEEPGTPTPTLGRTRPRTVRSSANATQVSPNTASQFWTASSQNTDHKGKHTGKSDKTAIQSSTQLVATEQPAVGADEAPSTPTPAPRELTSQRLAKTAGGEGIVKPALHGEDAGELTASENEAEYVPTSILRKPSSQKASHSEEKGRSTPELPGLEDSTSEGPVTPTPAVRRVHIELPPPSTTDEICKETPRKPHKKSSPIYQRHTQARSQYYSQGFESQRVPLEVIHSLGPQTDRSDILIWVQPEIVDQIVQGIRDHEFRNYKFPVQVSRCWIYTTLPVGEVKYMATIGPAQEPGQIDSGSGLGNAEFNAGMTGFTFAYKLLQVYQLNNPVRLRDMPNYGLGIGLPEKYRYIPPAVVGQLLANLRCALFADEDEQDEEAEENEEAGGGVTISQEVEEQLRSDILHSTQLLSSVARRREEEEDVIPASQSPLKHRSTAAAARTTEDKTSGPASQRLRHHNQQQSRNSRSPPPPHRAPAAASTRRTPSIVRPSQATTASDISAPPSSAVSSPAGQSSSAAASVPRPPMPESSEPSLPELRDLGESESLLPPLPPAGSSSQAALLPPDSLLVDDVRMAPPPVVVSDSEDDGGEDGEGRY